MAQEKPYKPLTRKGFNRLVDEFNHLRNVERPKVVQGVSDAAADGDRSENAEYIYGRKRLREIGKRMTYLSKLLDCASIVDPEKLSGKSICFGSTAIVRDGEGQTRRMMLVGEGESDAEGGRISWKSPVGRALLGKVVGDIVSIQVPAGEVEFEILEIKFVD